MDAKTEKSNLIEGATGPWEVVIGMEVHAQVTSKSKLFSGASTEFGGEPNCHVSLVDAAMPGMLPVINEECIAQAIRTGLGLKAQDQSHARSSTGRTISIPTCRRAIRSRQYKSPIVGEGEVIVDLLERRAGRGRHRAAASRAGRRQEPARPAPAIFLCRSQPLRRGADGDRVEARPALVRAGARLRHQAPHHPALSRHLRRQHGGGLAARRRQRVGAEAGRAARHALRDQERQLDPLHRPGHRARGAPPDRDPRGRRRRSSRRRGCSMPRPARRARCARRKRRTTTAISPTRTFCRSS